VHGHWGQELYCHCFKELILSLKLAAAFGCQHSEQPATCWNFLHTTSIGCLATVAFNYNNLNQKWFSFVVYVFFWNSSLKLSNFFWITYKSGLMLLVILGVLQHLFEVLKNDLGVLLIKKKKSQILIRFTDRPLGWPNWI